VKIESLLRARMTIWLRGIAPIDRGRQAMMKTDKQVQRDVLDELDWEPSVEAADIGITVCDGVVSLTGNVPSYNEKLTAERVAKRVHGVKAVANDIEVRLAGTGERTDADIAHAAVDALKWKVSVPDEQIKASVSKGWVTLEGEVDWYYQKAAAGEAMRPLLGVKGVTNLLGIKRRASEVDVKSRIEAAFRRSAELDAKKIQVETHEGKVTLIGILHSWAEREQAEQTAWAAPGVTEVENLIAITPSGA
jgi:osmotically-inducible protein OsmY